LFTRTFLVFFHVVGVVVVLLLFSFLSLFLLLLLLLLLLSSSSLSCSFVLTSFPSFLHLPPPSQHASQGCGYVYEFSSKTPYSAHCLKQVTIDTSHECACLYEFGGQYLLQT